MYDYCRKGEHRPIRVGDGVLFATDRQTQVVLLCKECEDVLNRGGEMWIAKKLATPEGTFPLYSILTTHPPDFDRGIRFYFAARNADVETDKLTHLALGIFWKASVHSWRSPETEPCIDLGPYSDRIRFWLRGENEFPKNVYLLAELFPPDRAQIALSGPYEGVRLGWRRFLLHLPGLSFTLNVGKTVDHTIRSLCIQTNLGHPIVVSDRHDKVDAAAFQDSSPVTKDRIFPVRNGKGTARTIRREVINGSRFRDPRGAKNAFLLPSHRFFGHFGRRRVTGSPHPKNRQIKNFALCLCSRLGEDECNGDVSPVSKMRLG